MLGVGSHLVWHKACLVCMFAYTRLAGSWAPMDFPTSTSNVSTQALGLQTCWCVQFLCGFWRRRLKFSGSDRKCFPYWAHLSSIQHILSEIRSGVWRQFEMTVIDETAGVRTGQLVHSTGRWGRVTGYRKSHIYMEQVLDPENTHNALLSKGGWSAVYNTYLKSIFLWFSNELNNLKRSNT